MRLIEVEALVALAEHCETNSTHLANSALRPATCDFRLNFRLILVPPTIHNGGDSPCRSATRTAAHLGLAQAAAAQPR